MEPSVICPFDTSYDTCSYPPATKGNNQEISMQLSDEEFFGHDLKKYFDNEEKNFLLSSLNKTSQDERSCLQSFTGQCHDAAATHKLTISQYIACRSEPLGHLGGDSSCLLDRPYFSFNQSSTTNEDVNKTNSKTDIVPDFDGEPSWLEKKSLSMLSSSENLGIESDAQQTSENWLVPTSLKSNDQAISKLPKFSSNSVAIGNPDCIESELPSLYWKPTITEDILGHQISNKPENFEDCVSYMTGNFANEKLLPSHPQCSSTQIAATELSASCIIDLQEDSQNYDQSLISEPQLSSTREITVDGDRYLLGKKYTPVMSNAQTSGVANPSSCLHACRLRENSLASIPAIESAMPRCSKNLDHAGTRQENFGNEQDDGVCANRKISEASILLGNNHQESELLRKTASCTPESWISLFTNTSTLSTPLLMNKVKEHILSIKTEKEGVTNTLGSTNAAESGFETTNINTREGTISCLQDSASSSVTLADVHSSVSSAMVDLTTENSNHLIAHPSLRVPNFLPESALTSRDANFHTNKNCIEVLKSHSVQSVRTETSFQGPILKCNKSQIFFGGAKLGNNQTNTLILRNSSYQDHLTLDLSVKGSESFKIVDPSTVLLMSSCLLLEPRQEKAVRICFQPSALGPDSAKLNIYPRSLSKKVKYSVDLLGYGGGSNLVLNNTTRDKTLQPYFNGKSWNCTLSLENTGSVAAFVCIVPILEPDCSFGLNDCIVLPSSSVMKHGTQEVVKIIIHSVDPKISLKLHVFWVDETIRACWRKCMEKGLSPQYDRKKNIPWFRFYDPPEVSVSHIVCEDDVRLFYQSVKHEEVVIASSNILQNSNFLSLAMETATLLDVTSSTRTDLTCQQNFAKTVSGEMTKTVSVNVTEIVFPATKVGDVSSHKIPLQNWSSTAQEVTVRKIVEPFRLKSMNCKIPGGFFYNLPIIFQPTKAGNYSFNLTLEVKGMNNLLNISLKGIGV